MPETLGPTYIHRAQPRSNNTRKTDPRIEITIEPRHPIRLEKKANIGI